MLNELFAREILETSIALGILQEMNGGVVIYHEASKEDPENLPAGWYIDDKDYTMFSIATDPEAIRELKPCLVEAGYQYEERGTIMTDKSIFTATRIRGEEKEFLGSVLLSSETDTASEFFRNIIKKDVKDVEVQKTETGYVLTDKADRDACYILTRTQLDDAFWNSCTADKKH